MGNILHKATQTLTLDPIARKLDNKIAHASGVGLPTPVAPKYDPSKNPGTHLFAEPGGGPPTGAPGSIFGPAGGNANAGYALNPWLAAQGGNQGRTGVVGSGPSGPGGSLGVGPPPMMNGNQGMPPSGAPSVSPGGVWLGRGGSNSQSQALQQQLATAQALRGPQMRVR